MDDVLVVCSDLMFTSKISGVGRDLGRTVRVVGSVSAAISATTPGVRLALLDLTNPKGTPPELIRQWREVLPPTAHLIGYGSHVEMEVLKAARDAGCDQVMVRSEFVQKLPELLATDSDASVPT